MASEAILAARRVKALEEQARQLAEVNRRLALIMKALNVEDAPQEKPAEDAETAAEKAPGGKKK